MAVNQLPDWEREEKKGCYWCPPRLLSHKEGGRQEVTELAVVLESGTREGERGCLDGRQRKKRLTVGRRAVPASREEGGKKKGATPF